MVSERIYHQVRGETGLTDVKVYIYDEDGNIDVSNGSCTELGNTGIYYYDFDWSDAGRYLAVFKSSTLNYQGTETVDIGFSVSDYTPSTTVTWADIKYDVGEVWNQVGGIDNNLGTTSAIVNQLIGRAETDVVDVTGTTAGYTQPIRYLSDAYTITHALGSMGPESDNESKIINMKNEFLKLAKVSFRRKGYDYENIVPAWVQVNY